MNRLQLLPIGSPNLRLLQDLGGQLAAQFRIGCELLPRSLDLAFAYHAERNQYHSSEILRRMQEIAGPDTWRILGVTDSDLYIPILTFVFGEAQLGGRCAVVSSHRLHQEFYGLPADEALLSERLLKEAAHELGHTLQLTHCENYECVMASSHSVEWIDVKGAEFCGACYSRVVQQSFAQSESV